jgi:3-(3-hydroxy-phenyl)propionate hydroxylase
MSQPQFDVVVVGYGPTGQALASLLARLGHSVCVFEKTPQLYGQPRLVTLDGEGARIVQAAGDVEYALRESAETTWYVLENAEGEPLVKIDWSEGGQQHVCGYPRRLEMFQPDVEESMDQAARERGVEVNMAWRVIGIEQDESGVSVTAQPRDSDDHAGSRTVRARYVVGADGANSIVRTTMGVDREDFDFKDAWLSIDCIKLHPLPAKFEMPIITVDPGRTRMAARLGPKRMRFELLVNPDEDQTHMLAEEVGYDFISQYYGLGRDDVEIYRQLVYTFYGKLAYEWRARRLLIAGDAAHLMPPFMGQGACSGLRDAINLAWKLSLVLRGVSEDVLLDDYQEERYPHVRVHVAGSVELGRIACERDPVKAAERDVALASGDPPPSPADPIIDRGILDLDDDGAPIAPAGELALQAIVRKGDREGRSDDVIGWGFTLMSRSVDPSSVLDEDLRGFLAELPARMVTFGADDAKENVVVDVDGAFGEFLDQLGVEAILVRPDFTIFGGVRSMDQVPGLVESLRRRLHLRSELLAESGSA